MLIRERCRHKGTTQSDLPNFVERDAEVSAVRNNQDLNNEMEVTVEERRDEENAGLKRKIDEVVQYAKGARARRKTKTAVTLKSPYLTRMIDPRDNVNTFEKKFWKWVVNKQDADRFML
ncbi:unnamed protein product [Cuscuta campestris]|uniref:Uncharacterized protein n=1 Tax=Cuscuta campestris TaxID=132261 RepID=A0A484LC42_9ASTE|nr:unnamed protein product [Cuscuta campestris]